MRDAVRWQERQSQVNLNKVEAWDCFLSSILTLRCWGALCWIYAVVRGARGGDMSPC